MLENRGKNVLPLVPRQAALIKRGEKSYLIVLFGEKHTMRFLRCEIGLHGEQKAPGGLV